MCCTFWTRRRQSSNEPVSPGIRGRPHRSYGPARQDAGGRKQNIQIYNLLIHIVSKRAELLPARFCNTAAARRARQMEAGRRQHMRPADRRQHMQPADGSVGLQTPGRQGLDRQQKATVRPQAGQFHGPKKPVCAGTGCVSKKVLIHAGIVKKCVFFI